VSKAQIERVVRLWQERLGLERWKLELRVSAEPMDGFGEFDVSSQYEVATITVASGLSPEQVEQTVVHELLHLMCRDLDAVVEDARGQLHPQASVQVEKRYEHEIEGFVERLALRLVELA
jgi:hypothetical protein